MLKKKSYFGPYGGQFMAETLMPAVLELDRSYQKITSTQNFKKTYKELLRTYVGRPTSLYYAQNLSQLCGGRGGGKAKIYLKREDLNHTGAHKINNTLGQILLAQAMRKTKIVAETGAGQHGVSVATVCAKFNMECHVFMGEEDTRRQRVNVEKMIMLGASVHPVMSGNRTLKDAMNEAIRYWITHVDDTYYLLGSVAGPHPYPTIVRDFQSVIGKETKRQIKKVEGRLPDYCVACVGGGSNAMGLFYPFVKDKNVELIGVEAAGHGLNSEHHSATLSRGQVGVLHGSKSYVLMNDDGQISEAHSIAAGLDYPGVGPEHSYLKDIGRATYVGINDKEALRAFKILTKCEGIIPALESSHAVAYAMKLAKSNKTQKKIIVVNVSGRGDKDLHTVLGQEC